MAGSVDAYSKKSKSKDPEAFMADVRRKFDEAMRSERDNRERAIEDAEFEADTGDGRGGDNGVWPKHVKQQREREGRICLTINKSRTITRQVANELRLQPPAISISPSEDGDVQTAAVIEGLVRSIEQASKAKRIYAKAGEDAARTNMGFWRVVTGYISEDSFDQEILIKPILNPMSVLYDPAAEDSTCRDAKFCFVYDDMPKRDFKERFKDKIDADFYADGSDRYGDWITQDTVRLVEYWCVEEKPTKLIQLSNGKTAWADDTAAIEAMMHEAAMSGLPLTVKNERTSIRKSVKMHLCSGHEPLEEVEWPGDRIPIIPVWGEEARVGSKRIRNGVLTYARDAIRLHTFARSANAETVAAQPKAPWLVTETNIAGYEQDWKTAATGNPAVLRFKPDPITGKPERMPPPAPSSGWVQEALQSADDIKSTTGIFDASLGNKSNETSGKAIMARQREGDVGTYVFVDNVLDAIEETGRVIINLIPHVYDAPRQVRILGKKMEAKILQVNQEGGIDLRVGKYDVSVSTGPSVTTQRQETAEIMTEVLQAAPMLAPVILPRLAQVIDLPDAEEFAAEVKQLLQPQQQQPNPKDMAQAENLSAKTEGQMLDNAAKMVQLRLGPMGPVAAGPSPAMGPQPMPGAPGAFQGPIA